MYNLYECLISVALLQATPIGKTSSKCLRNLYESVAPPFPPHPTGNIVSLTSVMTSPFVYSSTIAYASLSARPHGVNLAPTGIRSPDHPVRSQSLYRLSYRAHPVYATTQRLDRSNYTNRILAMITATYLIAMISKTAYQ